MSDKIDLEKCKDCQIYNNQGCLQTLLAMNGSVHASVNNIIRTNDLPALSEGFMEVHSDSEFYEVTLRINGIFPVICLLGVGEDGYGTGAIRHPDGDWVINESEDGLSSVYGNIMNCSKDINKCFLTRQHKKSNPTDILGKLLGSMGGDTND